MSSVDVNTASIRGVTPLMDAPTAKDTENLLKNGANPNAFDVRGVTALMKAKNVEQTRLLLEAGAETDPTGFHTAQTAKGENDPAFPLTAGDIRGKTPLMYAAEKGDLDMINALLDKGANINAQDIRKDTPLIWAKDMPTVRLLVERGADVLIRNIRYETAHMLVKNKDKERHDFLEALAYKALGREKPTN